MAWCPKCRTEYRPGVARCADCGSELIAALPTEPEPEPEPEREPPAFGEGEEFKQEVLCSVIGELHASLVMNALKAAGIPSRIEPADARDMGFTGALRQLPIGIYVNRRDLARAREIYRHYEEPG